MAISERPQTCMDMLLGMNRSITTGMKMEKVAFLFILYCRYTKNPQNPYTTQISRLTCMSRLETALPCPLIWPFRYDFASFQAEIVCVSSSSSVRLELWLPSCQPHQTHQSSYVKGLEHITSKNYSSEPNSKEI